MAAIITNRLRIFNAQQFIESLSEQAPLWETGVSYSEGDVVLSNSNLYIAVNDGTSSNAPTHLSGTVDDGTLTWAFYNTSLYNNLYLGIGKTTSWDDDSNPPTPTDSVKNHYTVKNDLISMKKVGTDTISLALPRINWTSGTVYTMYDDQDPEEIIPNGYVITEDNNQYNVFKCVNNSKYVDAAKGVAPVASTVKPSKPLNDNTSLIETGDGYIWKYMYSIELTRALKFLTKDYFPVKYLTGTATDYTTDSADQTQAEVQTHAVSYSGGIDIIKIVDDSTDSGHAGGSGYLQNLQATVTVDNTTTVPAFDVTGAVAQVAQDAGQDGYIGYSAVFIDSTGNTFIQTITDYGYSGSSTISVNVTLDQPFAISGASSSGTLIIAPKVQVTTSGSGSGCQAYALTNGDEISKIVVSNRGSGYTEAIASVVTSTSGTACVVRPILAPGSGHGYNPVEELGGYYVMVALKLEYDEQDTRNSVTESVFPVNTSFRQIIILSDPTDTSTSKTAANTKYRGPSHPNYSDGNSEFNVDAGTGKVLYVENRQPVSRAVDQIEDIKVVFEF